MHDRLSVGRRQDIEHLVRDGEDHLHGELLVRSTSQDVLDAVPIEQLHHQERGAVLRHVVVEHRDGAMGCFTVLATYPSRTRTGLRMETSRTDSSGWRILTPRSASGFGCVAGVDDGRHPPAAEHGVQPVLAAEHAAEALPPPPLLSQVVHRGCRSIERVSERIVRGAARHGDHGARSRSSRPRCRAPRLPVGGGPAPGGLAGAAGG